MDPVFSQDRIHITGLMDLISVIKCKSASTLRQGWGKNRVVFVSVDRNHYFSAWNLITVWFFFKVSIQYLRGTNSDPKMSGFSTPWSSLRSRHEHSEQHQDDDCLGSAEPLMDPTGDPLLDAKLSKEQAELANRWELLVMYGRLLYCIVYCSVQSLVVEDQRTAII